MKGGRQDGEGERRVYRAESDSGLEATAYWGRTLLIGLGRDKGWFGYSGGEEGLVFEVRLTGAEYTARIPIHEGGGNRRGTTRKYN